MKPLSRGNAVGDKTVPVSQHANAPLFPLIHTRAHKPARKALPEHKSCMFFCHRQPLSVCQGLISVWGGGHGEQE